MLLTSLSKHIKIVNSVLIIVAIIIFSLNVVNRTEHYLIYGIIINCILALQFMVNGVYIFHKKRSWSLMLITASILITFITILEMMLYY